MADAYRSGSMSIIAFRHRIARLDRDIAPGRRAAERMTDAELEAHLKNRLGRIDPALVDQWDAADARSKVDPDFSFLKATAEIWRQADEMLHGTEGTTHHG
jgi:hypothetical protein